MLQSLKINNIAVIESAGIEFDKGLNILTGETGAGKSIVIDSINAILGERTSKELIRNGTDSAKVIASFCNVSKEVCSILDDFGIEKTEDDTLTISRSISLSGRNSCKVNGWPVTVSQLKELGAELINIHGQHDSQTLLSQEKHCSFIDKLADNEEIRRDYVTAFRKLISVKKELDSLYDQRDKNTARADYLDYVIKEITEADIRKGETEELNKEKTLLQNSAKVLKALEKAQNALNSDGGVTDAVMDCAAELESASVYYEPATEVAASVKGLGFELSECCATVRKLAESFSYSPSRLSEIDDRLDVIYHLSMKYGKTEEDILEFLQNSAAEKEAIDGSDERITFLEGELYKNSDKVKSSAKKLTETRVKASRKFEEEVSRELAFLDMPYVRFTVDIKEVPLSSKGAESVEFLISANPGQEPKPIAKIASGGELSRIMLAIKNVLSDKDSTDTLIFDEIDAGVSGSAAEKIALKLYEVSRGRQVICVTHLARIAAQADTHMKIVKEFRDDCTYTKIIPLDNEGRAEELARITAGTGITELQLETAREMLENAKEYKK